MLKEMVNNAAIAVKNATAPIAGPGGVLVAGWNWLAGHDIAWFVGLSSLILIWLQIREKLFPRREAQ